MAAKLLADQGHKVVLHARNAERGRRALEKVPEAADPVVQEKFLDLCEEISGVSSRLKDD
jgi:NAD(P)-dependent dehydrogenase (short-subunit alcohol dehydrogenase family)